MRIKCDRYHRDGRKDVSHWYDELDDLLDDIVHEADMFDRAKPHLVDGLVCTLQIFDTRVSASLQWQGNDVFYAEMKIPYFNREYFSISRSLKTKPQKGWRSIILTYEGDDIWLLDDNKVRHALESGFISAWNHDRYYG